MRELKIEESKLVAGGVAPAIPIAAGAAAGGGTYVLDVLTSDKEFSAAEFVAHTATGAIGGTLGAIGKIAGTATKGSTAAHGTIGFVFGAVTSSNITKQGEQKNATPNPSDGNDYCEDGSNY